ncbi:hypothetical protein BDP27DRAFT_1225409 [Rhodocollybia butyracea]|uniref:Uncharacterized protein n=1 Tax=Rhodocollybia butyracea TaxID=206335 RepID=A0A9P5PL97_9AGAR|nr:hypothetical protein BDP27DRAFT_1225409 [Rhodocollybia butyracea]
MLLPLWPGDTDPPSHRGTHDYPPTRKMHIPPERKTFLLVWYKALDPQVEKEKGKRDNANHSVSNLTWAQVHANDDRNILLPGFLITARQVSYRDLQGTGVRVPDEGLTVNGPMDEAWREYNAGGFIDPGTPGISSFMPDPTIIAVCHSRESGVEFDPEALVSLGFVKC